VQVSVPTRMKRSAVSDVERLLPWLGLLLTVAPDGRRAASVFHTAGGCNRRLVNQGKADGEQDSEHAHLPGAKRLLVVRSPVCQCTATRARHHERQDPSGARPRGIRLIKRWPSRGFS